MKLKRSYLNRLASLPKTQYNDRYIGSPTLIIQHNDHYIAKR